MLPPDQSPARFARIEGSKGSSDQSGRRRLRLGRQAISIPEAFRLYRREEGTMKPSLRPGVTRVNRIEIDRERTIGFMGEEARTYGTPSMIRDVEQTCREVILEHADPGEDSVGMEVAI